MLNLYKSYSHYARKKGIDRRTARSRDLLISVQLEGKHIGYVDGRDIIEPIANESEKDS